MAEASTGKKLMIIIALAAGGILADYFDPKSNSRFSKWLGGL